MLRLKTTLSFCTTLLLTMGGFLPNPALAQSTPQDQAPNSKVIITEIKLGGPNSDPDQPKEFVSIFNQSDEEINLEDWSLDYAKAGFSAHYCDSPGWAEHDFANQTPLSGTLPAQATLSFEHSLTDNTDGSLRITQTLEDTVVQHDLVGWGNNSPCFEDAPSEEPSTSTNPGQSLQRYLVCDGAYPIDTNNNSEDLFVTQETSYGHLGGKLAPTCQDSPGSTTDCEGIMISEILPNPVEADSGNEFIELHNTTGQYRSLKDCGLQTSANNKVYWFDQAAGMNAGAYKAFYDDQTGLTLPNSAGGTVYLLSASNEELHSVTYVSNLSDDVSWAWFGSGNWQSTYQLTPSRGNSLQTSKVCPAGQARSADTGRCRSAGSNSSLAPCQPGQTRNPATNRCRSVLGSASQLVPCKPGQTRNPATNRCRSTTVAGSSLVPCKPDQTRNPATNRCRKVDATVSDLKSCRPDQERNPATNRCRKITSLTGANSVNPLEVTGAIPTSSLSTGLVATTAGLALVYGAYEFRHGIRNKFEIIRRYFSHRWHSGP